MDRRWFLKAAGLGAAALVLPRLGIARGRGGRRPNILFMMSDDQRWDAMGCMGNAVIRTPNMDRLAAEGVLFENAFLTTSICMASRASVMLGQFEGRHRCNFERPSNRTISYAEFENSYPRFLQRAGYRTGFIGKFGFAVTKEKILNCPLKPDGSRDSRAQLWKKEECVPKDKFDFWRGFTGQGSYFPEGKSSRHLTRIMSDQAVDFLDGCTADRPFCLSISFKAPHGPTQPDPAIGDMYEGVEIPRQANDGDRYFEKLPAFVREHWRGRRVYNSEASPQNYQAFMRRYYRCISGIDAAIGRIRDALRRLKLADNTVIIYTSDNGYFCGSKGLGGKALPYEESVRAPLIIFDPRLGGSMRGRRLSQLAANIDLAPTMLEMAGLETPATMQGASLLPLVEGRGIEWRDSIFLENNFTSHFMPALRDADEQRDRVAELSVRSRAVRTDRWKYICYFEQRPVFEELFDIQKDPMEALDLAGKPEHVATLIRLRRLCNEWAERAR